MVLTGAILHDSHCALSTTSLGSLLKLNFSLHFVCRLFLQLRLSGAYVPDGRKLCGFYHAEASACLQGPFGWLEACQLHRLWPLNRRRCAPQSCSVPPVRQNGRRFVFFL